jgi:predicted RNase H-like HicB family nuclease
MVRYIALIRHTGQCFRVVFPDFPDCVATGATLVEARRAAAEALARCIDDLGRRGAPVPEPRSLDAVMAEDGDPEAMMAIIPVPAVMARTVRVDVSLPEGVLARIDDFARRHNTDRSAFLARAAVHAMRQAQQRT